MTGRCKDPRGVTGTTENAPWLGLAFGTLCAVIWGVQAVVSRQSVLDGLTTGDVAVLRLLTSGLLLLPLALKNRPFPVGRLGWRRALVLTALAGTPYSLVLVGGVAFAPALHSAVLAAGLIPVISAGLAFFVLRERPSASKIIGLCLVVVGIGVFAREALALAPAREGAWRGDLLFVLSAAMWSLFGLLARRWAIDAVATTVTICVLSLLTLPIWIGFFPLRLATVAPSAIVLQALYQGVLVGVVSLFLYARTVALLGVMRASLFSSLLPGVTALAGFVLLGEIPTTSEMIGTLIVMGGMFLAFRSNAA
jgi:drug/metabolite transporter (DMT)-like permease